MVFICTAAEKNAINVFTYHHLASHAGYKCVFITVVSKGITQNQNNRYLFLQRTKWLTSEERPRMKEERKERDRGMNKRGLLEWYVAKHFSWWNCESLIHRGLSVFSYSFKNVLYCMFCVCLALPFYDYILLDFKFFHLKASIACMRTLSIFELFSV